MLVELRVRDLVLIETLALELEPGFNVLTGETGAGKSLVATAVGLLLGRKAGPEVVRHGAEQAEVEGLFDVSDEPGVREKLEAAGFPAEDELLIRRILPADGRQRSFVNGRLASLALLADLAEGLASFSGQHEHLALLEPAKQLALLDDYGGHEDLLAAMADRHAAARAAREKLEDLLEKERDRALRLEWLSFQVAEIEALAPAPDELDELARESARLKHQEELLGATAKGAETLYEAEASVYERIAAVARELERAARHDERLAPEAARLDDAAALVEETARRLADYAGSLEAEPGRLDEVEERRSALEALVKKHRTDLPDLLARLDGMREEVRELSDFEASVEGAKREVGKARAAAGEAAAALSKARRATAKKLDAAVKAELGDLALGGGSFEVRVEPADGDPGPSGADRAEFLVALNAGEGSHPIRKVASGGELSRLMLAVRRAVAGVGPVGTYVFDEVDSGIGGAVASAVGRKLREVAAHHQVICISHLPQIAGVANAHFVVAKQEEKGRTRTAVRRLTDEERVAEIARMLGGATLTEKTKAAARELIDAPCPPNVNDP